MHVVDCTDPELKGRITLLPENQPLKIDSNKGISLREKWKLQIFGKTLKLIQ